MSLFPLGSTRRRARHLVLTGAAHLAVTVAVAFSGAESMLLQGSLFTDVPARHPHEQAITWAEEQGLIRARADGAFGPDDEITRADFVGLLLNAANFKSRGRECLRAFRQDYGPRARFLRDVEPGAWYEADVCVALERGIIDGFTDETFRPDDHVSFAQAAVMLTRAYGLPVPAAEKGEPWYGPAAKALAKKNDIPEDVHSFNASISRAVVAEMLYRLSSPDVHRASLSYEDLAEQSQLHAAAPSLDDPAGELLALINATRWQHGLPAARANDALGKAARTYAADMETRGYAGHEGPGGSLPPDRIKAAGYETATLANCDCRTIEYRYGEAIVRARSADEALEALFASRTYAAIILSNDYNEAGVGRSGDMFVVDLARTLLGH